MTITERRIAVLFRNIEELRNSGGGDEVWRREFTIKEEQGNKEVAIFRLFSKIQWLLTMEESGFLEKMEDRSLARWLKKELKVAQQQIKDLEVPPLDSKEKKVTSAKKYVPVMFPEYTELPAVVRRTIMTFLSTEELLTMARAIPSEVKYFPVPLTWLQMKAVMPILIEKRLLDSESLMQLSGVNSYFETLVRTQLEQAFGNNGDLLSTTMRLEGVTLNRFAETKPVAPLGVPVRVILTKDDPVPMNHLQLYGNMIWHCVLKMARGMSLQEELAQVGLSLSLMPHLKSLRVEYECHVEENRAGTPMNLSLLPELPQLKRLIILNCCPADTSLKNALLRKYANKLDLISLPTPEDGQEAEVRLDGNGSPPLHLHICCVDFSPAVAGLRCPGLHRFEAFPVKKLDLGVCIESLGNTPRLFLPFLLDVLGRYWEYTLEDLNLDFVYGSVQAALAQVDTVLQEESLWAVYFPWALSLKKLKRFELSGPWLPKDCGFLLYFPALEELGYFEQATLQEDVEEKEGDNDQLRITIYQDREKMLTSNIWKLFPKMKQVSFVQVVNGNGAYEKLSRQEVVAFQKDQKKNKSDTKTKNLKNEHEQRDSSFLVVVALALASFSIGLIVSKKLQF